jgi:hypothetical protein
MGIVEHQRILTESLNPLPQWRLNMGSTLDKQGLVNRRDLFRAAGLAIAGSCLGQAVWPMKAHAAAKTNPRATARACIFIEVNGGISPMDCWDFKETQYTPKDFDVRKVTSDLYLSHALFPGLSKIAAQASFVRSMRTKELNHGTARYHTQTGRSLNPAVAKEVPAFGSVIAAEMEPTRRDTDTFPGYMSCGLTGGIGSGFFPPRFAGVDLDPRTAFDSFGGSKGESMDAVRAYRYEALQKLMAATASGRGVLGDRETAYSAYTKVAYTTLGDPRWAKIFQVSEEDKKRYGNSTFGLGALLARNIIAADAGARVVYLNDAGSWDNHSNIFEKGKGLYGACAVWDPVFTALITDLAAMPGHAPGKTLLDETLIVTGTEFGRTPAVNNAAGRDHYPQTFTSLWMGGGVKPGRIIGKTDETGARCIDTGWKHKENPFPDNVVATIYSALGIDWGKVLDNTPSGRPYEFVQTAPLGGSDFLAGDAIDELFA